ncbi:hypothetical protein GWN42_26650 [candidate division KSB1 bacterium]|nr:hypothetical protein [candidate division KSB1 bacterium]NIV04253.1 hypothetical protein [Calditrichia bacterium]NIS23554.1 hypothetical protein [candidate division KSB1 bacterium]NIU24188.1 hypothetical protein [candidate division KSB1 bacterium]NIV96267.1 hypothetical protein [candidate division KSB1 bacterium]
MEEEISLDERFVTACGPLVDELIEKYCSDLKQKICTANSRKQAELIANQAYREFERRCVSEIMPLLIERHFKNLIQQCWGDRK